MHQTHARTFGEDGASEGTVILLPHWWLDRATRSRCRPKPAPLGCLLNPIESRMEASLYPRLHYILGCFCIAQIRLEGRAIRSLLSAKPYAPSSPFVIATMAQLLGWTKLCSRLRCGLKPNGLPPENLS